MKPIYVFRSLAIVLAVVAFDVGRAAAAGADCLPCVYVRNDSPYFYAEVCTPLR